MTKICLSLAEKEVSTILEKISAYGRQVDLVEIRVDALESQGIDVLQRLKPVLQQDVLPVLWTVRWKGETGAFTGSEEERLKWLEFGDEHGARWIDVEACSPLGSKFKPRKAGLVSSYHNFDKVPEDLDRVIESLKATGADVLKVALAASCTADCRRTLDLYDQVGDHPLIAISMGEWGECSRVLPATRGLPWTYASLDGQNTAPGQFSVQELNELYRLREVDDKTPVYVVIGDPVSHSLSAKLHNAYYGVSGTHAVYGRIHVDDMEEFYKICAILNIRGVSVTVPHKESLMKHLDADHWLQKVGAANTLVKKADGWVVHNTDIAAAIGALKEKVLPDTLPRVLLLGAGGVVRGLASGLLNEKWSVTICNRTAEKAKALAAELGVKSLPWEQRTPENYDIVINGTTLGMTPNEDQSPMDLSKASNETIVFDTVYTPEWTRFLKQAKARGAQVITGREMFYRQAALQHQHWFGGEAPLYEMKKILAQLT